MADHSPERVENVDPAGISCRIGARRVSRSFGSVHANADISLSVRPGTIHAVVGENGAGKSTLMKMLYGLDQPDTGAVILDDEPIALASPRAAIAQGIGLVQQELAIIPELTLLENLILGDEPHVTGRIDWKTANAHASQLAKTAGITIAWETVAHHTSIAIQQQVEILRLIQRGAHILILDEPTSVLAPAQAEILLDLLRALREAGRTIVFISHKLDEVLSIADDITVLRGGRVVASRPREGLTRDELAQLIVGDTTVPAVAGRERPSIEAETVLRVDSLSATDDRGIERVSDVSFDVGRGEIVGIAAVAGNGQEELAEVLAGVRRISTGALYVAEHDVTRLTARGRRLAGLGYVSADRKAEGLAPSLSITDNIIASPHLSRLARVGWLSRRRVVERVNSVLALSAAKYGARGDAVATLSGGNQQRIVMGRETIDRPAVLIASQPTRGVDIRGIASIHSFLLEAASHGTGIVLFSEELDELRQLADRIIVLHHGRIVGELPGGATRVEIGELMLGRQESR